MPLSGRRHESPLEREYQSWIPMALTALTVIVAAALGGAVAIDVNVLVITAVAVLALLGVINALRMLGELTRFLRT